MKQTTQINRSSNVAPMGCTTQLDFIQKSSPAQTCPDIISNKVGNGSSHKYSFIMNKISFRVLQVVVFLLFMFLPDMTGMYYTIDAAMVQLSGCALIVLSEYVRSERKEGKV